MYRRTTIRLASFALAFVGCFQSVPAEAGLLDWLFPGRRPTTRQYYLLPNGTSGLYTTNYAGWGPSTAPYAWYAPQTQYRTMWAQVPTTSYRPVGTNGLQPCTSYSWQARRMPVIAYQPSVLPTAPALPTAPTSGCSSCSGSSTAFYGGTNWQPAATSAWATTPATGTTYGYANSAQFSPTTAGYAPVSPTYATNYGAADAPSATPWTPVAPAGYAAPTSSDASVGATPWTPVNPASGVNDGNGESTYSGNPNPGYRATPWQPVDAGTSGEAYDNQQIEPTPADRAPTLNSREPQLENSGYRRYVPPANVEPAGAGRRADYRYPSPPTPGQVRTPSEERFTPWQQPIPDPDRIGNGWDFDDSLHLRSRTPRSAQLQPRRSTERWAAIPQGTGDKIHTSTQRPVFTLPARRPGTSTSLPRGEGEWRASPR